MFKYKHLYELQDYLLEHKEPKDNRNLSFFIEAAGDIFRELTLDQPDDVYIREKIRKLDKFKEIKTGDILELNIIWKSKPHYKVELLDYLNKVNQLVDAVDRTHFGNINRKDQMLRTLVVISTLVDFGMFGSTKAEDDIERLKVGLQEFLK